ncbi:MAG: DUF1588 domain-containing protein [Nannocystales bacterium]
MKRSAIIAATLLSSPGCYEGLTRDGAAGVDTMGATSSGGEPGGDDSGDSGAGTSADDQRLCDQVGVQELRMLTSQQYANSVEALLPAPLAAQALEISTFPQTRITGNFSTFASANRVNSDDVARIEATAESIGNLVLEDFETYAPQLDPCLSSGTDADTIEACIDGFIDTFGAAAFRRPVTAQERAIATHIYEDLRDSDSSEAGFVGVVQFALQAPGLLYATERGTEAVTPGLVALDDDAIATRMGLLFLDGPPDEELLRAAAAGELGTRDEVSQQARRLVAEPELVRAMTSFHHEWLRGFVLDDEERTHPLFTDAAADALRLELRAYARWFVEQTDGRFTTLMTSEEFSPDTALIEIYAASPPGARAGLLTTAAAMASLSAEEETSIIQRGHFLREHVLCLETGSLPDDVDTTELEDASDRPTARERLEPLLSNPSCAGCHVTFNPLGFPFEQYDWVGAFRSEENGATIDASLDLSAILGPDYGLVSDASSLVGELANTPVAQRCYARHWFRYSLGRLEDELGADECAIEEISNTFIDSGGDVRELLVAISTSTAFRFRKSEQ